MYDFSIWIPFKSSQSTLNFEVPWSAVSILVSGVNDKNIDFIVEYLREYVVIWKKALTRWSRAQMELFDEKNRRSKISWQGPFKLTNHTG
jgi:hypothetical protein